MAEGSEKFMWKLFPGIRRQCWQCKHEPLKIDDVGEHRRRFPGAKDEFLCKTCQKENVQASAKRSFDAIRRS